MASQAHSGAAGGGSGGGGDSGAPPAPVLVGNGGWVLALRGRCVCWVATAEWVWRSSA